MGRRLYVGNLAWTVTDQDLHDAFSEAGKVDSSQVIIDRATNRSRGFGFVEINDDAAAQKAVDTCHGKDRECCHQRGEHGKAKAHGAPFPACCMWRRRWTPGSLPGGGE